MKQEKLIRVRCRPAVYTVEDHTRAFERKHLEIIVRFMLINLMQNIYIMSVLLTE